LGDWIGDRARSSKPNNKRALDNSLPPLLQKKFSNTQYDETGAEDEDGFVHVHRRSFSSRQRLDTQNNKRSHEVVSEDKNIAKRSSVIIHDKAGGSYIVQSNARPSRSENKAFAVVKGYSSRFGHGKRDDNGVPGTVDIMVCLALNSYFSR
jgi:hypothetical protein